MHPHRLLERALEGILHTTRILDRCRRRDISNALRTAQRSADGHDDSNMGQVSVDLLVSAGLAAEEDLEYSW